jgi:3-methyladenine DNA glycosylase AlkD
MQEEIIRDIRKRCRQAMNGVVSSSMRSWGLDYKINFGLTIQQIKDISRRYEPDAELAGKLWKENTRELKILATMLYPVDMFSEQEADRWVSEIANQEIREQLCFNLLQELPYAEKIAMQWANNPSAPVRTTGYWLLSRLLILKCAEAVQPNLLPFIWDDVISEDISLKNATLSTLKRIGQQAKETADTVMQKLAVYRDSEEPPKREIYDSLDFEFRYYFEN